MDDRRDAEPVAVVAVPAGGVFADRPGYRAVQAHVLPAVRALVDGLLQSNSLDAIVYSTSPRRPVLLAEVAAGGSRSGSRAWEIASLTGYPDLIVPSGFTSEGLPVMNFFLGAAFTEPKRLAVG